MSRLDADPQTIHEHMSLEEFEFNNCSTDHVANSLTTIDAEVRSKAIQSRGFANGGAIIPLIGEQQQQTRNESSFRAAESSSVPRTSSECEPPVWNILECFIKMFIGWNAS